MSAPYQKHSSTSREAAELIEPRAGTIRAQVLDIIRIHGHNGMTDEELLSVSGLNASTGRPRRVELTQSGLVVDSGRERRTKSGRNAVVWVAKEFVADQVDMAL